MARFGYQPTRQTGSHVRLTTSERSEVLSEGDLLEGGDILPGFRLALTDPFAELDRSGGG